MLPRSKSGLLRRCAPRNDVSTPDTPPYSRGAMRPSFANTVSPLLTIEGAGNAGRSMHPQPRVRNKKAHERSHHGHTGTTRHSPRNGFTAYFALSPVTRLV